MFIEQCVIQSLFCEGFKQVEAQLRLDSIFQEIKTKTLLHVKYFTPKRTQIYNHLEYKCNSWRVVN